MRLDPSPNRRRRFSSTESSPDGEACGDGRGDGLGGDDEGVGRGFPGFVGVVVGLLVAAGGRLVDLDAAVERDVAGSGVVVPPLGAGVAVGAAVEPGAAVASRTERVRAGAALEPLDDVAPVVPAEPVGPVTSAGLCESRGASPAAT